MVSGLRSGQFTYEQRAMIRPGITAGCVQPVQHLVSAPHFSASKIMLEPVRRQQRAGLIHLRRIKMVPVRSGGTGGDVMMISGLCTKSCHGCRQL